MHMPIRTWDEWRILVAKAKCGSDAETREGEESKSVAEIHRTGLVKWRNAELP
jgi:hypothetical protein